jgi:Rieske 2Fe-2S family protein
VFTGRLRRGAESWTVSGRACGPALPGLGEVEKAAGQTYAVAYPSFFAVGHVDYVRTMRVEPLGPGRTRLHAEWLFPAETLAAPGFDLADVVEFAKTVIAEDGAACETNQRGLDSPSFERGVLMQEEYDVHAFQAWVREKLGEGLVTSACSSRSFTASAP